MGVSDKFRLRRFMEQLVEADECRVVDRPVDLIDVAAELEGEEKAVWFKAVGPEKFELTGNVAGARSRLALAFGVKPADLPGRLRKASTQAIPPIEVPSSEAPAHE